MINKLTLSQCFLATSCSYGVLLDAEDALPRGNARHCARPSSSQQRSTRIRMIICAWSAFLRTKCGVERQLKVGKLWYKIQWKRFKNLHMKFSSDTDPLTVANEESTNLRGRLSSQYVKYSLLSLLENNSSGHPSGPLERNHTFGDWAAVALLALLSNSQFHKTLHVREQFCEDVANCIIANALVYILTVQPNPGQYWE